MKQGTALVCRCGAAGLVSLGPRRNSLLPLTPMDERRAVSLVVQFLHEGGFKNALTALQEETCASLFMCRRSLFGVSARSAMIAAMAPAKTA